MCGFPLGGVAIVRCCVVLLFIVLRVQETSRHGRNNTEKRHENTSQHEDNTWKHDTPTRKRQGKLESWKVESSNLELGTQNSELCTMYGEKSGRITQALGDQALDDPAVAQVLAGRT